MIAVLEQSAGELIKFVNPQVPVPTATVAGTIRYAAERLTRTELGRRAVLGRAQEWYGRRGAGTVGDALDALVDLARWSSRPDGPSDRQRADELWCNAFLSDLVDNFRRDRHADEWTMNCAVLIDNVDSPLGRRLLITLAQVRRDRLNDGQDPDPVTVIVSSRGRLLDDIDASAERIGDRSAWETDPTMPWLRVPLRDLTLDEVTALLPSRCPLNVGDRGWAGAVHRLTHGQPAATDILLRAAGRTGQRATSPAALLLTGDGQRIVDDICDRLLAAVSPEVVSDLVTLAAARDRTGAARLAARARLLRFPDALQRDIVPDGFWDHGPDSSISILRRLLLRRLDERPERAANRDPIGLAGREPGWRDVHNWLRTDCQRSGDLTGELYYALAQGAFNEVVSRLATLMDQVDGKHWLALLHAIVQAPRRAVTDETPLPGPLAQADRLAGADGMRHGETGLTADLLSRLWVAADPLAGEPRAPLHWAIATNYESLNHYLRDVPELLHQLQREHRRRADQA